MKWARNILIGGVVAMCCAAPLGVAGAAPSDVSRFVSPTGEGKDAPVSEVKAEIIVLHATNDGKGIDPGIGKMPELKKPPFSSYDTYKQLDKFELKLPKGELKDHKLPDGGKLSITFKEFLRGKKKDEPSKFVLATSIDKPDGKKFLPSLDVSALQGEYFFVAGQKFNGGILVLGIKIK